MLLALPKLQCYRLQLAKLARLLFTTASKWRGDGACALPELRVTMVTSGNLSIPMHRSGYSVKMSFTLPSKSSYLDSFFIALTISTRSERYTLIHRLIINTFWPWRALVHYFCLTSQTKHSGFIITQFIFDQDQ